MMINPNDKEKAFMQLREIKTTLAARGWFPATSGNLSIRTGMGSSQSSVKEHAAIENHETFQFAITASGKDKSINTDEDFLIVDEKGIPVEATPQKPSAETLIHCEIYRLTGCGAIFHVHTIYNNIISEFFAKDKFIAVKGVELIKGLNIWEEDAEIQIPILPNFAEIPRIVELIEGHLTPRIPAIVLRNHGIYAWGANAFEAKRHLEAFEFLFEYLYRWQELNKSL